MRGRMSRGAGRLRHLEGSKYRFLGKGRVEGQLEEVVFGWDAEVTETRVRVVEVNGATVECPPSLYPDLELAQVRVSRTQAGSEEYEKLGSVRESQTVDEEESGSESSQTQTAESESSLSEVSEKVESAWAWLEEKSGLEVEKSAAEELEMAVMVAVWNVLSSAGSEACVRVDSSVRADHLARLKSDTSNVAAQFLTIPDEALV